MPEAVSNRPRALILTGGIFHPFVESSAALAEILAEAGFASDIRLDVEAALNDLARGRYRFLVVYALRWRMMDLDKYAPYRAEWAMTLSAEGQEAIADFVSGGGGLLGLHTASICFDNWPGWGDVLGARWRWGTSFHPPSGPVSVKMLRGAHPVVQGVPDFDLEDEVFQGLDLAPDAVPLATASLGGEREAHAIVWTHHYGRGRVVYDALGHDAGSFCTPAHRLLLGQAIEWIKTGDRR